MPPSLSASQPPSTRTPLPMSTAKVVYYLASDWSMSNWSWKNVGR